MAAAGGNMMEIAKKFRGVNDQQTINDKSLGIQTVKLEFWKIPSKTKKKNNTIFLF